MEYNFRHSFNAQFNSPMLLTNVDNLYGRIYFCDKSIQMSTSTEFIILIFYINSNEKKAKAEENNNAHLIHSLKPTVDPLKNRANPIFTASRMFKHTI